MFIGISLRLLLLFVVAVFVVISNNEDEVLVIVVVHIMFTCGQGIMTLEFLMFPLSFCGWVGGVVV